MGEEEALQTQLPGVVNAPQLARAFLRAALQTWELDGFGEVTELLASELVTNVVVHVASPMTLRVTRRPSSIRVEVEDPSTERPTLLQPDDSRPGGRGIFLIDAFADAWGTDVYDDHKSVWFELDVTTGTEDAHGASS